MARTGWEQVCLAVNWDTLLEHRWEGRSWATIALGPCVFRGYMVGVHAFGLHRYALGRPSGAQ